MRALIIAFAAGAIAGSLGASTLMILLFVERVT